MAANVKDGKAVPVWDCHSLPHLRKTKSAKACLAADAADGLVVLQNPSLPVLSVAFGVSVSAIAAARRLTPTQRMAVRCGYRPLIERPVTVPVLTTPKLVVND